MPRVKVAVLVPCYNEGSSIAKVVKDFRACLPKATVYVYDNNSTDQTAERARRAGGVRVLSRVEGIATAAACRLRRCRLLDDRGG